MRARVVTVAAALLFVVPGAGCLAGEAEQGAAPVALADPEASRAWPFAFEGNTGLVACAVLSGTWSCAAPVPPERAFTRLESAGIVDRVTGTVTAEHPGDLAIGVQVYHKEDGAWVTERAHGVAGESPLVFDVDLSGLDAREVALHVQGFVLGALVQGSGAAAYQAHAFNATGEVTARAVDAGRGPEA